MRRSRHRNLAAAVAMASSAALGASAASAQSYDSLVLAPSVGTPLTVPVGGGATSGSVGGVFLPGRDIVVDQLGFYDYGGDGLQDSHLVGLWSTSGGGAGSSDGKGKLLASVTVNSGTGDLLQNGYRWITLATPITLRADTYYVLGATVPNATGNDAFMPLGTTTYNPNLTGTWSMGTRYGRYMMHSSTAPVPNPALQPVGNEPGTLASSSATNGMYGIANMGASTAKNTFTGSGNWSSNANWQGGAAPAFGGGMQQVTFGAASGATANNDVANVSLRGIEFAANAPTMTLTGNAFQTIGGIRNLSTNTQTFDTGTVTLYSDQSILPQNGSIVFNSDVDLGGSYNHPAGSSSIGLGGFYSRRDITFNGKLTGTANMVSQGYGVTAINNNSNDITGTLSFLSGTLRITASNALGTPGNYDGLANGSGYTVVGNNGENYASMVVAGNINLPEQFVFASRNSVTHFAPHVINESGNNSIDGIVFLSGGANSHTLRSDAGMLTLTGTIGLTGTGTHPLYLKGNGQGELALSGGIIQGSGANVIGLAKQDLGTWTISRGGSNYSAYTSAGGGRLVLDYSTDNGDLINGQTAGQTNAPLWFQGGTLVVNGNAGAATDQSVPSTLVNPGGGTIETNPGVGQTATLRLNAITRVAGGGLNFTGTGTTTTTSGNNAVGLLGAWAVHNGSNWATNANGTGEGAIVALAPAAYAADAWATNYNTDITASGSPAAGSTTGTLRFNAPGGQALTLTGANTLETDGKSGGVLVTANAGAGGTTITGGALRGVNATNGQDLVVHQYNTNAPLTISSTIANAPDPTGRGGTVTAGTLNQVTGLSSTADLYVGMPVGGTGATATVTITALTSTSITLSANATAGAKNVTFTSANGLTKTGPGTLVLTGANTHSGPTYVNGGTLRIDNGSALSNSILHAFSPDSIVSLNTPSTTVNGFGGYGTLQLNGNDLTIGGTGDEFFYGSVLGDGNLIVNKSGTRSFVMHGAGNFDADVTVNAGGRYLVRNPGGLGSTTGTTTVNSGGELDLQCAMDISEPIFLNGPGLTTAASFGALHVYGTFSVMSRGLVTLQSNSSMYVEGSANFVQAGDVVGNNTNLTLGGAQPHSAGTIDGAIATGTGGVTVPSGNWFLNGNNTYSGVTAMSGGYLTVKSLGTVGGAPSNLGQPTAGNENIAFSGAYAQLAYAGAGETTSRGMTLSTANAAFINVGGPVSFTGAVTIPSNRTLVLQGSGSTELSGAITGGGAVTVIGGNATISGPATVGSSAVDHGTLFFNSASDQSDGSFSSTTGTGKLRKAGTGTLTANVIRFPNVSIEGGTVKIAPNGTSTGVSRIPTLSITGTGRLDLSDNKLIVPVALGTWGGTAYTGVSGLVDSGRGNASNAQWDGSGIVTGDTRAVNNNDLVSIGAAKVGAIKGIADTATTTFAGQTVLGSDTVAMVTWGGDANLDGKINIDDYGQIDFNVSSSGSVFGWYNGDFNYDGKINIDDYGIIDFNVSAQDSIFPTAGGAGLDGVAAVPEPSGVACLVAAASAGLLRRRRRNKGQGACND